MTDALDLARCDTLARALYDTKAAEAEDALVAAIAIVLEGAPGRATRRGWMRPDGTVSRSLPGALASWMSRVRGRGRPSNELGADHVADLDWTECMVVDD